MKNLIVPISILCLSVSFTTMPRVQEINRKYPALFQSHFIPDSSFTSESYSAEAIYSDINLQEYGLSEQAFYYAWKGYQQILKKNLVNRSEYLTICDFSQSSRQKRLYVIDLNNKKLVINTYVAHGRNSGAEYANRFSNKPNSLQSSLGFYLTKNTYTGEHGLALRIEGIDAGFNDKAMRRNIVVHGATYIDNSWLGHGNYMGRSYGCPAIPQKESNTLINTIKNGTCLFIYYPSKNYLLGSKILNG